MRYLFEIRNCSFFVFSNKIRINLNVPFKSERQKEERGMDSAIEEERKILIQGTLKKQLFGF